MKLIEIKTIKKYQYIGKVYDLEVEEDHSYNINGIVVHNSDYVMVGSIFNKAIESCGDNYLFGKIKVSQKIAEKAYKHKIPVYKKFRGMSTKEVQKKWGKKKLSTSEGVIRIRKVEYSLSKWVENFEDYLRSAMSYTDSKTLNEFIGNVNIIKITDNAYNRFKK